MKRTTRKPTKTKPLTDAELDGVLRAAKPPTRPASYWKHFTKRAVAAIKCQSEGATASASRATTQQ